MTQAACRSMRAMLFAGVGSPLRPARMPVPEPGPGQVLLRVLACGVCRTDLHLLDGEVDDRQAAARPRPSDRRPDVEARAAGARRRPLARLDVRRVPRTA